MGNETAPYALKYTVTNYCFKNCIVAKLATNSCGRSSCLLTVVLFHKRMIVIKTNETQYRTTAFNTNGRESIVSMFINDKHQILIEFCCDYSSLFFGREICFKKN